jgi:hypothetical protein
MREAGSKLVGRVRAIVVLEARPVVSPLYDDGSVTEDEVAETYRARYGRV